MENEIWVNATVIAAAITAITAIVGKIIELVLLRKNKIREIDYENEAKIKNKTRDLASSIVSNANSIAVSVVSYIAASDSLMEICSENPLREAVGDRKENIDHLMKIRREKITSINTSSYDLVENTIQLQLLFVDKENGKEHLAIEKSEKLQELASSFKDKLNDIQSDYGGDSHKKSLKEIDQMVQQLNKEVPEFVNSVRKTLRIYKYNIGGKPTLKERIKFFFTGKMV